MTLESQNITISIKMRRLDEKESEGAYNQDNDSRFFSKNIQFSK